MWKMKLRKIRKRKVFLECEKLDEREAYWIALGKNAVSDKKVYDEEGVNQFIEALNNPDLKASDIKTSQTIKGTGELTNRTRGNNVRM